MNPYTVQTPALAVAPLSASYEVLSKAAPTDDFVEVSAPNGERVRLVMTDAVSRGLVELHRGRVVLTHAGAIAVRRMGESQRAGSTGKLPAGADAVAKPVSARMGEVASAMFLARGALTIAKGPGLPKFPTAWFFLTGANKYMGKKLLPQWLQEGPIRTGIDFYIPASMLMPSLKGLGPAASTYRAAVSTARVAGHGGPLAHVRAAFAPIKDVAAGASAAAKPAGLPNLNLGPGNKIYDLIKPLTYLGYTISSAASILGLPEHLKEKGAGGLLSTKSGRGALLGAASGASMLASLWIPPSPIQAVADAASMVLWMAELVNGEGWMDGILGGDPEKNTSGKSPANESSTSRQENVPGRASAGRQRR